MRKACPESTVDRMSASTQSPLHSSSESSKTDEEPPKVSVAAWKPHEAAWTETPCLPLPRWYFSLRWWLFRRLWTTRLHIKSINPAYWITLGDAIAIILVVVNCLFDSLACISRYTVPLKDGGGCHAETGFSAVVAALITYTTACHNSIWTVLMGIPFERCLYYHRLAGLLAVLLSIWHGCVVYSFPKNVWLSEFPVEPGAPQWARTIINTGWVAGGFFVVAGLCAIPYIRRKFFDFFYRTHVSAAAVAAVGMALHCDTAQSGSDGHYNIPYLATFRVVGPGIVLWALDLAIRHVYFAFIRRECASAEIEALCSSVVKLAMPKVSSHLFFAPQ